MVLAWTDLNLANLSEENAFMLLKSQLTKVRTKFICISPNKLIKVFSKCLENRVPWKRECGSIEHIIDLFLLTVLSLVDSRTNKIPFFPFIIFRYDNRFTFLLIVLSSVDSRSNHSLFFPFIICRYDDRFTFY